MKYPVFLQALALTVVVFIVGIYLGMVLEQRNLTQINKDYIQSEVSLVDILALNNLIDSNDFECKTLEEASFYFMDRVYEEAIKLEDYESSGKFSEELKEVHKKYDILRTFLWIDLIKTKNICKSNFSTIIYLYNYNEEDLTKKAEQKVWSEILYQIKKENENLFLIPIAVDTNLVSLNTLISKYNLTSYPAVIVDEKDVFTEIKTKEEVEYFLR